MNRPWMPIYWADYLADTGHLSTLQHGAYLLLMAHYWRHGCLPNDEQMLCRIVRMQPDEWAQNRAVLQSFFSDKWKHQRIDAEIAKTVQISEKRQHAAMQRHFKSNANVVQMDTHSHSHSHSQRKKTISRADALEVEFEELWKAKPARLGPNPRAPALKAYRRARKVAEADFILSACRHWASGFSKVDEFVPMLRTWLSEARFEEYTRPDPARRVVTDEFMKAKGFIWDGEKWVNKG